MEFCRSIEEEKELEEDDIKILGDQGYSNELYRGVSGWFMNFAFTFTAVSVISSYSILYGYGIQTGGPVVMVWGWVIGSLFTILAGFSMAEICSAYPSAGSVYHWTGRLAPLSWAPFLSYICGWFNWLGNLAGDASFAWGFATVVVAAAELHGRRRIYKFLSLGHEVSNGGQVGISIGVITFWSVLNILRIDQQGWVNTLAAIYQVLSSLIIIIVILASPKDRADADFVFTEFNNDTGLQNHNGYVVLLGLLTAMFSFSGYEAGGHVAEETKGARKAAPKGMYVTVLVAAVVGFAYILGLLFATPDPSSVILGYFDNSTGRYSTERIAEILGNNYTGYDENTTISHTPIVNLFVMSSGYSSGLALSILLIINLFFAGMASVTITARITFALARDKAFPFSNILSVVNDTTKSPICSVIIVWLLDIGILLLPLVSSQAFVAILSITTVGFQLSYAIPIWLRVTVARHKTFDNGFSLGRLSLPCGWFAANWLTWTSILFFWPSEFPVTAENMNYTVVVVGAFVIFAAIYWIFARSWFIGPKRPDRAGDFDGDGQYYRLEDRG